MWKTVCLLQENGIKCKETELNGQLLIKVALHCEYWKMGKRKKLALEPNLRCEFSFWLLKLFCGAIL